MKSIQRQLILRLLGTTLPLAGACGGFLYFFARERLVAEFDRALIAKADLLANSVTTDGRKLTFDPPDADLSEFQRARHPGYFQIWRSDATVLARSASLNGKDFASKVPIPSRGFDVDLPDGKSGRAVIVQFQPQFDEDDESDHSPPSTSPASATLLLASDRDDLDDTLGVLASSLLAAAGVLALGIIAAVMLSVRRGLRPLHQLAQETDSITAASLDHRFATEQFPVELKPIGQRLNELLTRIDQAFTRERRFTADVAHELRTPIAELRSLAEVALKWPDKAGADQNFNDALAIAGQMESLVTTLLTIARCQAGSVPAQLQDVDLSALLQQVWRPHAPAANLRQLSVTWETPMEATVKVDRAMLTPLLDNLISNAVTYTPPGGSIELRIAPSAGGFNLSILNTCENLDMNDLSHIFEPFWRKDSARTSGLRCGLGLSLVTAYAAAMKIEVAADMPARDRFRIKVTLPRSAKSSINT